MVDLNKIAKKWQRRWEEDKVFQVEADKRPKYYIAFVYPYMSGLLHLGHLFTYTFPEVLLRYKRMRGFNVLGKFGFHCTGTPIVSAAQRVKEKEPLQLETLRKMGIEDFRKFEEPEYWCDYFPKETMKDLKHMGFALDERYAFRTTYLDQPYDDFIRWQFRKLREKGYVKKGKHPVMWCPKDNVPVGDHDRYEGEGEVPQEFLLFKHKLSKNRFVLTATLRHDTVLGITNLFVNPDTVYKEARVDDEIWILGAKAVDTLKNQGLDIKVTGTVEGQSLIGKKTEEFDGSEVLILPAAFLKEDVGTGLVHSVPSDSPDDLIALRELQKDAETCKKFNLDIGEVKKIRPIPVLRTPDYGGFAAEVMLKKYEITSQNQKDKLEKAKKEIYKISHYTSTFNQLYKNKFSVDLEGKKVEEGKDVIKEELIQKGFAVKYYEPTGKVVCRCLTECIIKVVEDQWFIEYNDEKWKKRAHECLDSMKIYPEVVRKQFEYVVDWLNHWACTREFGLGTKLPWDEKWVIESLSDSTIQMAYGTVSKYLENSREYGFKTDKLNDNFFEYVFLGEGDAERVEKSTGVPNKMLQRMRSDFAYWYPYDFRNSAKDLLQNHLTFSIFNHAALFPKKHWPKAFVVNGRIMVDNEKMSKSKGNFFTMRELYLKHSPDVVRLTSANAGEGVDDANYEMSFLDIVRKRLDDLHSFIKENYNEGRSATLSVDMWFKSIIHETIKNTTNALENMLFKSAVQFSFLDLHRNLKWYLLRTDNNPNKKLINFYIEIQLKLLAPFTPHFCEECWELIGKKGYISNAEWPKAESGVKPEMKAEELIRDTLSDIREVLKLAKVDSPKKIRLFVSPPWKYKLFSKVLPLLERKNSKEILEEIMKDDELKSHGKDISRFLPKMINERKVPASVLTRKEEFNALKEAKDFMEKEFKFDIEIIESEKSREQKAKQAMPGKVAILIE
jgi:leucyl-tRNA synthetase